MYQFRYQFRNTKFLLELEAWLTSRHYVSPIFSDLLLDSSEVFRCSSVGEHGQASCYPVANGRNQISSHQLINQTITLPQLYRPSIVTNTSNRTGDAKVLSSKVDISI